MKEMEGEREHKYNTTFNNRELYKTEPHKPVSVFVCVCTHCAHGGRADFHDGAQECQHLLGYVEVIVTDQRGKLLQDNANQLPFQSCKRWPRHTIASPHICPHWLHLSENMNKLATLHAIVSRPTSFQFSTMTNSVYLSLGAIKAGESRKWQDTTHINDGILFALWGIRTSIVRADSNLHMMVHVNDLKRVALKFFSMHVELCSTCSTSWSSHKLQKSLS